MKRCLIDCVIGIAMALGIWLLHDALTDIMTIGIEADSERLRSSYHVAFLISGIVAGMSGFVLGLTDKINPAKAGSLSGGLWAMMVLIVFLVIGLIRSQAEVILSSYGFYVAILCVFLGPVLSSLLLKGWPSR